MDEEEEKRLRAVFLSVRPREISVVWRTDGIECLRLPHRTNQGPHTRYTFQLLIEDGKIRQDGTIAASSTDGG